MKDETTIADRLEKDICSKKYRDVREARLRVSLASIRGEITAEEHSRLRELINETY